MAELAPTPAGITGSQPALVGARSGQARAGASRSGFLTATGPPSFLPIITIDGVRTGAGASRRVLVASLTIADQLNEVPNTCTFTVQGARPVEGSSILIAYGDAAATRLFSGSVIRTTQLYVVQNPANTLYQVEGIDHTWELNRRLVVAKYTSQSATDIAADLVATWVPSGAGFTTAIEAGLPVLDEISFTNTPFMEALTQLATRIGGYANCNYYKAIGLWLTPTGTPPAPLTPTHPSLQEFQVTRDLSQIVTRALVEGGGVTAIALVAPGESRIPVDDPTWYVGGVLVAAGPQRVKYTDVVAGGAGAFVGPGVAPSSAPVVTVAAGAGLPAGTYKYAYTWGTAAGGETIPSPVASAAPHQMAAPTRAPLVGPGNGTTDTGGLTPGATYSFKYAYALDNSYPPTAITTFSPAVAGVADSKGTIRITHYTPATAADCAIVYYTYVYRTKAGGAGPYYVDQMWRHSTPPPTNTAIGGNSTYDDTQLGNSPAAPVGNTANLNAVLLSGIGTGPTGTTKRTVYRTAVNGAQLKLLTTLNDNTTTVLPAKDTTSDAALGANAPTADTSGLNPTSGAVLAGATSIPVSSVGPFGTTGWAVVANQVVRYTGASSAALTGIPASGPGALTASVNYGREILVASQLIGIPASGAGAIRYQIQPGDGVNLLVIVDDLAAQAALAALLGGDGVVEEYQQDRRINRAEAQARADALLELKGPMLETYRYRSRDLATASGKPITVDLPAPVDVHGTYEIQDVTIAGFLGTEQLPLYDVVATSRRFTFEDLLRRRRAATTTG